MGTVRDKASDLLKGLPNEVRSDLHKDQFSTITNGMTHEKLQAEWEATKDDLHTLRTVCIDFVSWYAGKMGIDILSSIPASARNSKTDGFFDLQKTLEKCGKAHAWVSAASGARPKYGDILRHVAFHVDVCEGFDGDILLRIAGGQSWHPRPTTNVKAEYDNVLRVRGKGAYNPSDLQGWLDIELFFEPPPLPIPASVVGWWKVMWRNGIYYYYLGLDGTARWTQQPPLPIAPIPFAGSAPRTGRFKFQHPNKVTIRWHDSGSVEVFDGGIPAASGPITMTGTWNGSERIEAVKL